MGKTLKLSNGDTPAVKPQTQKVVTNSVVYPKRVVIDERKGITTSDNVTFVDMLNLCLNAIVSNAFRIIEATVHEESKAKPGEEATMTKEELETYLVAVRKNVTAYMYDKMNEAFSDSLAILAPDIQQHPGITEIAIMKCEDELIRDYLASLPEEQREVAQKEAEKLLAQSKRALLQKIEDQKEQEQAITFTPAPEEQPVISEDGTHLEIVAKPKATCEGICAMCSNDPCLKAPTIGKMFDGLE